MNLSDLVRREGYGFVVDPKPRSRPDVLGLPPADISAAVLCCKPYEPTGRYIACIADELDHVYAAAHEIAEDRYGHTHSEKVLSEQSRILARWVKQVAGQSETGRQ